MRDLVWSRSVHPNVTVGLDDSLSLVLNVTGDCDTEHQFTISNGDDMIRAVRDARIERVVMEAQR